jgi:DNA repair exonuclease SbcCD ATPase subunit
MRKNSTFIILGILAMFISLFSLSCSSEKSEKIDTELKQLLSKAIQGIDALEKENTSLKAKLDKPTKGNITRNYEEVTEELKNVKNLNEELKAEVEKLKRNEADVKMQLEARAKIENEQIASLQKEISKLKGMLSFSRLQLETKQEEENARIAGLSKENSELQEVLNKIHAITQAQPTGPVAKPQP